jgi:Zn-dependent protease with chaperone function
MQRASTMFLRGAILSIGAVVLAICILALPTGIVSDDAGSYIPILLGLYVPAVPFFIALSQTLKLLHYIDENTAFSELSVRALKRIKQCAVVIAAMFVAGLPYIYRVAQEDDAPGVFALGLIVVFASIVIAVFATVLQKLFKSAIDIKSENDLTV